MKEKLEEYKKRGLVYSQTHPTLPLTIYNYTDKVQWEGLWDEVTLSARGLIIDNNGDVVAKPFKKFFNLSEGKTKITENYEIFQKYDGSLGILFNYKGEWILASRGSFTSEQAVIGKYILGREVDYTKLNNNFTYCFEIIYRDNKIVVDYGDLETLICIGVFDKSGKEHPLPTSVLNCAQIFNLETPLEYMHKYIKDNEEGYVIRFDNGERCKIKGAEYLRLHKLMSEISSKSVWDCLRNGSSILSILEDVPDEFYKNIKNYEEELQAHFNFMESSVVTEYSIICKKLKNVSNKEFALYISNHKFRPFLFSLRNGKSITKALWDFIKPEYRRL